MQGSLLAAENNLQLVATDLPMESFGIFITSRSQAVVPLFGGGNGTLLLGSPVDRFVGPGQVLNSGALGSFRLAIDLNAMPLQSSPVAVQPGETWYFQAWHRDVDPVATSNLTNAVGVTFL